ncbi:MAG: hypothetical protein ABW221_09055 [Vicinamibacteria bacterium]
MRRLLAAFLSFGLVIPTSAWAGGEEPHPSDEAAAPAGATNLFTRPMVPAGRVRVTTFDRADGKGGRWYDGQVRGVYEGRIQAVEGGVLVIGQAGGTVVRISEEDVLGVEVRKNGSAAMGTLGALLGIPAGLMIGGLVCVTADGCSEGLLWGGALAGGLLGATAMGRGEWETVPVVRLSPRRVSLVLQPAPKGGGLGLRVSF